MMTNPDIDNWYRQLPGNQRRRLNHPGAIIAKYKRTHEVKKKDYDEKKLVNLDELIEGMQEHFHEMDLDAKRATFERLLGPFKAELRLTWADETTGEPLPAEATAQPLPAARKSAPRTRKSGAAGHPAGGTKSRTAKNSAKSKRFGGESGIRISVTST
jgi:hypothetical protein